MPIRADIEAATPKCPRLGGGLPHDAQRLRIGQRCGQPCRWDHAAQRWECATHGAVLGGLELARIHADGRAA